MAISTPPGYYSYDQTGPLPGENELPYSDGEPMDSEKHQRQMLLLMSTFDVAWADRDDVYVGGNMFVYFSALQIKKNDFRGPDLFIVLNTKKRVRKSWVVWEEGGRTPNVVIELVSESTEHVDRGEKMRIYSRLLRVANYYIFDPESLQLDGFQLDPQTSSYVRIEPDGHGDLDCPELGLSLGVRQSKYGGIHDDWLRFIDKNGRMLPTIDDIAEQEKENARLAGEQARLAGEQARVAGEQARVAKDETRVAKDELRAAEERAQREARMRADLEQQLADALAKLEQQRVTH